MGVVVPKEAIEVIAQSIGIDNLSSDVAAALAPDVEYRLREIMQEAIKCMRHSRRTVLTSEDVDSAFKLRNVEPIYGFTSGDPLRFKRASGHKDLYYIDEKDVEFKDVIDAPLPKFPLDVAVTAHWLAVEGVQPAIPENPPSEALTPSSDVKKYEFKEDSMPVDIKLPVKHVLSRELQLYFEKIKELTLRRSDSVLFKQALLSVATDSGLHPLVPYFTQFISDEIPRNLTKIPVLFALMRVIRSIIQNPHIHIEPYLHQLVPSVITCLVAKGLEGKVAEKHWDLRKFSASLIASICKRFGHAHHNLQPRVTRTLLHAFLDPNKTLPQHYGAIEGLSALGPAVVRLLILPNLEAYLQLLKPEMQLESQKNERKRMEAWCVYGALLSASGMCMYNRMKKLSILFSPSTRSGLKVPKIARATTNKRKASSDNLQQQQPPPKKLATENALASVAMNPMQMERQGTLGGFSAGVGVSNIGIQPVPRPPAVGAENMPKASNVLAQAWKEDVNVGHMISSLYEVFDEGMLPFMPKPELMMFI